MEPANNFTWIDFYTAFATKLLDYKNDRQTLIQKVINTFNKIGIPLPTLEKGGSPIDIDPFTVFGLFNKGITDDNRKAIIGGFLSEFSIDAKIPDDFSGIPTLNPLQATYYGFEGSRNSDDIDNLWKIFEIAILFAEKENEGNRLQFCKYYDKVRSQYGVKWNLTMGLYWVRPYTYLNLDSRNRWFLKNPQNFSENIASEISKMKDVPSGQKYLEIRDDCISEFTSQNHKASSFPELSFTAWRASIEYDKKDENDKNSGEWFPSLEEYDPGFTSDDWLELLNDPEIIGPVWGKCLAMFYTEKEGASCKDIGIKFSKDPRSITAQVTNLSKAIYRKTGCPLRQPGGKNQYWPILFVGRYPHNNEKGTFIWKLRSELYEALTEFDISRFLDCNEPIDNALGDSDVETIHYWLYAPGENASKWNDFYKRGVMAIGWMDLGNLDNFANKNEMVEKLQALSGEDSSYKNIVLAAWQFAHDIKPGDVVFVKRGRGEILGRGIVESDYQYDQSEGKYPNIREVKWTHKGVWKTKDTLPLKTLTDISNYTDFINNIKSLFESEEIDTDEEEMIYPPYSKEDFLKDVYIDEWTYSKLTEILRNKKNLILQGAPGVGKTFLAKRLAYSIMGKKDVNRVMMVQFHQSYSYEDFIMGFRPSNTTGAGLSFELKEGVFYSFCKKAENDSENDYFFIIDEINRGNLSKIFGELFMLIENDKRGYPLKLMYRDELFSVPKNLYIIGMMNTADRSLAMLDYALRRRFAFFDLKPGFASNGFRAYQSGLNSPKFDSLIHCMEDLNRTITEDDSLGEGFCIGHSYFCNIQPDEVDENKLSEIVEYELIPLIREYWFDEPQKVKTWTNNLRSSIK